MNQSSNIAKRCLLKQREKKAKDSSYHDLDHLWGSWPSEETKAFKKNAQPFERIDPTLWDLNFL